jgi:hypothetical protein
MCRENVLAVEWCEAVESTGLIWTGCIGSHGVALVRMGRFWAGCKAVEWPGEYRPVKEWQYWLASGR